MALPAPILALLAMTVATAAIKVVPMDMAQDSFDDQYRGCGPVMTKTLPKLHNFELQKNPLFARGWAKATAEWKKRGSPVSPLSSPAQAVALMAYSVNDVYSQFNAAVRVAGRSDQVYRNQFHFKALHFLLTQALMTLRNAQNGQCRYVFRGVRNVLFRARRGQKVRFGQFTSTSTRNEIAQKFGTDTMFQVYTCYGASIREFSMFPGEEEVLIPPFETFEVTKVTGNGKSAWISLRSTGTFSNYNCVLQLWG